MHKLQQFRICFVAPKHAAKRCSSGNGGINSSIWWHGSHLAGSRHSHFHFNKIVNYETTRSTNTDDMCIINWLHFVVDCILTAHFRFFMLRCCFFSYINFTIRVHFCCRLRSGDAQAFFLIGMCWKIEESHIELKEIDFWSNTDSKFSTNLLESAIKSRALIRANKKKIATKMCDWTEIYCFILSYIFFVVLFNLLKSFNNDLFSALLIFFITQVNFALIVRSGVQARARSFFLRFF